MELLPRYIVARCARLRKLILAYQWSREQEPHRLYFYNLSLGLSWVWLDIIVDSLPETTDIRSIRIDCSRVVDGPLPSEMEIISKFPDFEQTIATMNPLEPLLSSRRLPRYLADKRCSNLERLEFVLPKSYMMKDEGSGSRMEDLVGQIRNGFPSVLPELINVECGTCPIERCATRAFHRSGICLRSGPFRRSALGMSY